MRLLISAVFLMAQLGPLAGAAMCLHAQVQARNECSMPMPDMEQPGDRPQHAPTSDCAHMAVCAPPTPVVPAASVRALAAPLPTLASYPTPSSLLPGEPLAPPDPPPNA